MNSASGECRSDQGPDRHETCRSFKCHGGIRSYIEGSSVVQYDTEII